MKKKTKNKLENKWLNLPGYEDRENYLNKIGYKYRGVLSISAPGEIIMTSIRKFEEETERGKASLFISELVNKRKIDFSSPQFNTYPVCLSK